VGMNCKFCKKPVRPLARLLLHIEVEHPEQFKRVQGEIRQIRESAAEKEEYLRSTEKL